jgi:hypothetical protein
MALHPRVAEAGQRRSATTARRRRTSCASIPRFLLKPGTGAPLFMVQRACAVRELFPLGELLGSTRTSNAIQARRLRGSAPLPNFLAQIARYDTDNIRDAQPLTCPVTLAAAASRLKWLANCGHRRKGRFANSIRFPGAPAKSTCFVPCRSVMCQNYDDVYGIASDPLRWPMTSATAVRRLPSADSDDGQR